MKKSLVSALVALFVISSAMAQDDTRSVQTWKVQKYDITATVPQDDKTRSLTSTAVLTLKNVSGRPASSLTLRISPAAEVSSIKVNNSVSEFAKSEEKIGPAGSLQRVVVRFPAVEPDGIVTASVEYKLTVKENSGVATLSPSGSQFLPMSFWYPTPTSWFFTRGVDAAPVRLRVNSGANQTIAAAGTETSGAFETKHNGQPFFVSGSWTTVNTGGVTVLMPNGASTDGQKRAAELATLFTEARTFAATILGPAPDAPLRIVSVRRGAGFAGGGTALVDEAVFRRAKIDSLTAMSIAEAAARLWLGNSIAVSGEAFGVVQEGLTRYIATQFVESRYGKDVADIERLRQRTAYSTVSKRDLPMRQVSPLDDFYYQEVANKGAMAWRLIAKRMGAGDFSAALRANSADGELNAPELRMAFSAHKDLVDYLFDQATDMNLLVGLPQTTAAETKVALRNTGSVDASVTVTATTVNGQLIEAPTTIRAQSFGEVVFKSPNKVARVEVDTEKLYPQAEYSDDIAPRETTDTDLLLAVKRSFDKQDHPAAEKTARVVLASSPRLDDVRILLGRSLLAQGRSADAEREFRAVLDEKLPTARSIAWANVGLAEAAAKSSQNEQAVKFAELAILADAEYGASLAARNLRNKLGGAPPIDPAAKAFFAEFDKAATSNRKADVDALVVLGEASRFAGGISGSTEQWQTQIRQVDKLDANTMVVETSLTIKLLTKEAESGLAVFRLSRVGSAWKLSAVDIFEVR